MCILPAVSSHFDCLPTVTTCRQHNNRPVLSTAPSGRFSLRSHSTAYLVRGPETPGRSLREAASRIGPSREGKHARHYLGSASHPRFLLACPDNACPHYSGTFTCQTNTVCPGRARARLCRALSPKLPHHDCQVRRCRHRNDTPLLITPDSPFLSAHPPFAKSCAERSRSAAIGLQLAARAPQEDPAGGLFLLRLTM